MCYTKYILYFNVFNVLFYYTGFLFLLQTIDREIFYTKRIHPRLSLYMDFFSGLCISKTAGGPLFLSYGVPVEIKFAGTRQQEIFLPARINYSDKGVD